MHKVTRPKRTVVQAKKRGGPTKRIAIVAGSLKTNWARVAIQMAVEYRSPTKPKSAGIEVAEAELMMPESMRFSAHSKPAIVHSRKSIFRTMRLSSTTCACWPVEARLWTEWEAGLSVCKSSLVCSVPAACALVLC